MIVKPDSFKEHFEKVISKYDEFAIIPHYNPDPDSIGSAFGINSLLTKTFNKKSTIFYGGIIGRAENNMMIQTLDIPVIQLKDDESLPDLPIILMDTQPDTGNNPLKDNDLPFMIFDHHPFQKRSSLVEYADVRLDYGATCSLVYRYFKEYNLKPTQNVATALYYGIQTDVVGKGRTAFQIDFNFLEELSKHINREKLYAIEKPDLPFDYYLHIKKGLENSVMYDAFLISSLGDIKNPDYIGEIADYLIRCDKVDLVLVMGIYKKSIQISFRSQIKKIDSGSVLKQIIGTMGNAGGHAS